MAKENLLFSLLRKNVKKLSKGERSLLEVLLFTYICQELTDFFWGNKFNDLSILSVPVTAMEENMKNVNIMQELLKDILASKEYTMTGIAIYTQIPEDVLCDLISGINPNPTFELSKKILELHVSVRRNLYENILLRVAKYYLETNFIEK